MECNDALDAWLATERAHHQSFSLLLLPVARNCRSGPSRPRAVQAPPPFLCKPWPWQPLESCPSYVSFNCRLTQPAKPNISDPSPSKQLQIQYYRLQHCINHKNSRVRLDASLEASALGQRTRTEPRRELGAGPKPSSETSAPGA